jgi:hypothetical protein
MIADHLVPRVRGVDPKRGLHFVLHELDPMVVRGNLNDDGLLSHFFCLKSKIDFVSESNGV